ncbi:MAG TPA: SAM-dependent methyltransferase [Candidatus Thermoplasmatota archaeon]|jgi:SAM-dependent MidA family methyltransferase|nr:SAM-dependent methyltransferase [Candidatus Thermoplasmatota archaeon]
MTPLQALLVARIRARGPMTFRAFMAEALYHPDHGYYTTGKPWRGEGDFTTAPRYGDAFALGIARFAARVKEAMGPGPFEVVEVGAGSGALLEQLAPLLEPEGVRLRAVDHRRPPRLPAKVPWTASLRGLEVRGLVLSNELFDALPVHRVTRTRDGLRELCVGEHDGRLVPQLGALSDAAIERHLERFGPMPAEGQTVEVGLDALAMLREMAGALREGCVLTIDYGHSARELQHHSPLGTLTAVRAHRLEPDPLVDPGELDLTAHVNFTALTEAGKELGLQALAEVAQWEFLASTGALEHIAGLLQDVKGWEAGLAAKTLVTPGRMGEFRVHVQAKGLAPAVATRIAAAIAGQETLRRNAFQGGASSPPP